MLPRTRRRPRPRATPRYKTAGGEDGSGAEVRDTRASPTHRRSVRRVTGSDTHGPCFQGVGGLCRGLAHPQTAPPGHALPARRAAAVSQDVLSLKRVSRAAGPSGRFSVTGRCPSFTANGPARRRRGYRGDAEPRSRLPQSRREGTRRDLRAPPQLAPPRRAGVAAGEAGRGIEGGEGDAVGAAVEGVTPATSGGLTRARRARGGAGMGGGGGE